MVRESIEEARKGSWVGGTYYPDGNPLGSEYSPKEQEQQRIAAAKQKEQDQRVQKMDWDRENRAAAGKRYAQTKARGAYERQEWERTQQDAQGKKDWADQQRMDAEHDSARELKQAEINRRNAWRKAHPWKNLFGVQPPPAAPQTESYGMANETHEEGHGGSYDRNTQGYLDRMTWGMMPSDDLLEIALAEGWHMNLKGRDALSFKVAMEMAGLDPGRAERGMSTVEGMKQVVEALVSCSQDVDPEMTEICESAGSLAGSIMDVLGFEWI